ncbi:MAG: putative lipid II flippase FtsW [Propionibacteriales bacterium]|nr:putative lipid II flippase FtsW [Propionibacteriales bacterium]
MATASEGRWREASADGFLGSLKSGLDRPTTSYHLVLGACGLLLVLGLLMVLSASSVSSLREYDNSYAIFLRQAMWVTAGLPLAWVASRLPLRFVRALTWPGLLFSVVLIALTYVPTFGVSVNGNRNWLTLGGPFQVQPSELAKLALVLWVADVYARKGKLLHQWRHLTVPLLPMSLVVIGLVVGQGDLGTALVLLAIVLGMLWVAGAPIRLFAGAFLTAGALAFALATTERERVARLTTFLDPVAEYSGNGWQASHGFFALATGGLWGRGIGASNQKWGGLPEAHTDYIFAIIGEEFGLFGTLVVLALFATLAFAGIRIAARTVHPFVRYASAGIVVWLLSQALINIGMVLGLLPVIGIPLPLISYGGSALVPTLVAIGLLLSFARTEPGAADALRARRQSSRRQSSRRQSSRRAQTSSSR